MKHTVSWWDEGEWNCTLASVELPFSDLYFPVPSMASISALPCTFSTQLCFLPLRTMNEESEDLSPSHNELCMSDNVPLAHL